MPPQLFQFKHVPLLGPGLGFFGVDLSFCLVVASSCVGFRLFDVLSLVFCFLFCLHSSVLQVPYGAAARMSRGASVGWTGGVVSLLVPLPFFFEGFFS